MQRRSAEEIWQQLVDEAGEDEVDRAASVSVAQAEKELAEAGFDVAEERARSTALLGELESGPPVSGQVVVAAAAQEPPVALVIRAPKPERKRWIVLVATATLAAGALTVAIPTVLIPLLRRGEIGVDRWEASTLSPTERASVLRRYATNACRERRWDECRRALDDARGLDPSGEQASAVGTLRKAIEEATAPPTAPPTSPDIKDKRPDIK